MSNPKQLKAVLTSLREAIASLETEPTTNSTSIKSFCLVLTSELSSRGIAANLPQGNDNYDSSSEWIVSLLESIQVNAGKVAIDDVDNTNSSNYPAPMMAALNAAQGMAVSACAKICCPVLIYNHGDEHLDAFELLPINANKDIAKAYKDALKRCQDVEDGRLYTLLQLVTNLHSVPDNVDKSSLPKSKIRQFKLKQLRQLQYTFYTMAYANYLHGAVNYAVDQPPMWKRCLDSALLLNGSNDDDDDNNQDSFVTSTNNNNNESGGSELNYKAYFNSRTIQPLNNMIRIAQAKGNEKRAKELSLLLAVGYLGGVRERLQDMKKTNKDSSAAAAGSRNTNGEEEKKLNTLSVKELVQQFYVDRTPLPVELEIMTVPSLLEYSKKALSACDAPTTIEDTSSLSSLEKESWILYHYIQEQMVHLAEESMIWSDVHRQYRSMLNRKPESNIPSIGAKKSKTTTGTKKVVASSKEEMEQQTRTKVYAEAYDEWKVDSLQLDLLPSLALRDAVLSLSSSLKIIPQSMTDIIQDCYRSLIHQMERLEAMAVIVQKKSTTSAKDALLMWEALLSFISPLMRWRQDSDNFLSSNVPLRNLLETCSEAIIVASWMCEPIVGSGDNVSNEINNLSKLLSDAQRLLTACKAGRVEEKRLLDEKNKEESVLSSKESQSDLEKKLALRLECAIETSRCRAEIDSVLDADGVDINAITAIARRATISATGGFKNIADCNSPLLSASSSKALFGTPYLHFLSVWSGMYLSPWPYCNVGQARAILKQARDALRLSAKYWGRRSSNLEDLLLDIGEADLENVLLGGNADASSRLYHQALAKLEGKDGEENASGNALVREKLKVQCLIGLARQSLSVGNPEVAETHARSALNMLLSSDPTLNQGGVPTLLCSYAWCAPALNQLRHSHQLCSSRQLVAESCIQSSRFDDARSFLTDAVKEVPGNFDAAFSLASFYLRMHCMGKESDENETRKSLLRAAKMDTSKASPFALLGIWYESKNDAKRAEGCYQKALSLDASHPVAGRGLQRLIALEDLVPHCKKAIEQNSPVNGWAWQALGESKALHEGDDSTAVICFQQALRCRDIQSPSSDMLGAFYSYTELAATVHSEASMTWVELATCYRRMGKYSAALRAYEEAASTGTLPPAALCSWAQCDLDLGLYAEAAEKCDDVLACEDCPTGLIRMASYIEAEALLSIARTDIQGGKNGSCRSHLVKAITRLEGLCPQNSTYCEIKLLGDLYSFGEALPPYVFDQIPSGEGDALGADSSLSAEVEDKISFLQKGEEAYAKALELAARMDDQEEGDKIFLLAATGTDLGINLLSQARTIAVAHGDGSGGDTKTAIADLTAESDRVKDLILRSINAFSQAIDHSPNDAGAWCGLGSALIFVDPLLSQHAFCRALQIDKSIAEPLSSIALLYADYDKTDKSAEILDALTQLEDTPLMWIGRGLLLEKTSRAWHDSPASREGCLTRASDAYRASLQIMQHPAALLGLSLTCRRADADVQTSNDKLYSSLADHSSKVESRISMTLHQSTTGGGNIGASMIDGLFRIEEGLDAVDSSEASRMIKEGVKRIEQARSRSSSKISNDITSSGTKCEINFSSAASLQKKDNGEFPNDGIEKSLSEAARDLALDSPAAVQEYSLDQARNAVVLNPDSGESWLLLAKELTQAASSLNDAAATSETLSSAKAAADKALDLLQDQLLNACLVAPRRKVVHHENLIEYSEKSVVSAIPPSPLVSDAMSLVCWLGSMDEENQPQRYCATLQESLLLNPLNEVAATALGL